MKDKHVIVVGAGIIGLCSAYYLNKKGLKVTVLDNTDGTDNCSFGNAGFFVPSHIVPLASPGIVSQGLRWMMRSDSPFYIKPKLDRDLISWGTKFYKAANPKHVAEAAPILNELLMESLQCRYLYSNENDQNIIKSKVKYTSETSSSQFVKAQDVIRKEMQKK